MTPTTSQPAVEQSVEPGMVRLQRVIAARPEQVYRAWLEPDTLRRWLAPGGLTVTRAEVDEQVGGHYRIWQGSPEQGGSERDVGGFDCEIRALDPGARIVFRWGFVGPDRLAGPTFDSRLTITLREAPGDATELTLVHERLDALRAAMPAVAEQVGPGWKLVLDRLTQTVE